MKSLRRPFVLLAMTLMIANLFSVESRNPVLHRVGGGRNTWNPDANFSDWSIHQRFFVDDWLCKYFFFFLSFIFKFLDNSTFLGRLSFFFSSLFRFRFRIQQADLQCLGGEQDELQYLRWHELHDQCHTRGAGRVQTVGGQGLLLPVRPRFLLSGDESWSSCPRNPSVTAATTRVIAIRCWSSAQQWFLFL